ncbi:MAG: BtaA family protein, partial [Cyclobacteriaceae bacterium]|nr:BtaA family protein [Cyclobacteriaceae bacterium]
RYANCWEDADLLLEGLNPKPGSKILSIGSAGDNSFSLLTTQPELVVAVDVNKIQLYLIELKKAGFTHFSYEEFLLFFGFKKCENRHAFFERIKGFLSEPARQYWENQLDKIEKGIISQGKFEKYFQLFSSKVLPWVHSRKTVEGLFRAKSREEQEAYYIKKWNTWRWRFLFKLFFSKYVMGKMGRDPEFLREVKVSVGEYIFQKAAHHLRSVGAQDNFILRYNLTGSFEDLLPHYLQPDNYELIKSQIEKIQIVEGYAEDAFRVYGKFNYMNLSDIFEYMDEETFSKTALQLVNNTLPGGKIAYWNLMVPRRISKLYSEEVEYLEDLSKRLTSVDKGFFYNAFIIDQKL